MNRGYPTIQEAESLLKDAETCNPGPWADHSRTAARCAEKIAAAAGMDPEKSYVLGLLHDIGRKFGVYHMPHIYNGWKYMLELGYDEAARVCLTHSFSTPDFATYIGKFDLPEEAVEELRSRLSELVYDDYDRLIQLCDCLAGNGEVVNLEERMLDVKRRYGEYPQAKWDNNLAMKAYFDKKCGMDVYVLLKGKVSVEVIPFTEQYLDAVWTVQREAYKPLYEKYHDDETSPYLETKETILRKYTRPGTQGYLFRKGDIITGAVRVALDPQNSRARISALGVLPKFQGRGIAQRALLEIERMHPEVRTWTLDTILEEQGNCRLYEKLGYRRTGAPKPLRENMTLVFYGKP